MGKVALRKYYANQLGFLGRTAAACFLGKPTRRASREGGRERERERNAFLGIDSHELSQ